MGIPINKVTTPKYTRESKSKPTVNIWWAHTKNPTTLILNNEYNMALKPKTKRNVKNSNKVDIKPNTGKIII